MVSKSRHNNKSKYDIFLILFVLQIGLFVVFNVLWEYYSFIMPCGDTGVHMLFAERLPPFKFNYLIDAPYPKLQHYLTKPLLNAFADEKWAFFTISSLFAIANAIITYLCTAHLSSSRIALFAASSLLWLPLTITASRTFTLDYPQATCLTLWFFCFLKSKRFTKIIPSISFVFLIFLSSLFRYTYFTYIIPCFTGMAYYLYNKRSNKLNIKHLAVLALPLAYSASLFFTKNWIIAVKFTGIILFLEGLALLFKDRSMGKLFSLTGLGLIISIFYFSIFADTSVLNNIAHQERINITTSIDFSQINPKSYLSCLSLLTISILFAIRMKLLAPVLFWYFAIGASLIIGLPKLRHRYLLLIIPLSASPLYLLFTTAEDRFQSPMMAFFCMVSAVWLGGNKFKKLKSLIYAAGLAIITLSGAYISGGWLISNTDRLPAHLLTAGCGNETISAKPRGSIIQNKDKRVYRIEFSDKSTLTNFCSNKSQWSDSFLYTFDTYGIDWRNCLEPIMQLPDKASLQTVFLNLNDPRYEFSKTGTLDNIIQYFTYKRNKEIIISNKGQYILRIQAPFNGKNKKAIQFLEKELSQQLADEADRIESWKHKDYTFTLYKRKDTD